MPTVLTVMRALVVAFDVCALWLGRLSLLLVIGVVLAFALSVAHDAVLARWPWLHDRHEARRLMRGGGCYISTPTRRRQRRTS